MDKLNINFNYLTSKTHLDKVFVYTGQNYGSSEANALKILNDLSRNDRLTLSKRQISNKKVKLIIPNDPKYVTNENQNYQNFISNFNKTALACYLRVLGASNSLWSGYSLDEKSKSSINFKVLNSKNENIIDRNLQDGEFIKNYLNQVIKIHNQVVKKLSTALNTKKSVHFGFDDTKEKTLDKHLYRSFRVLGLRKSNSLFKTNNKNNSNQSDFNEIVDIRATFNINQSNNKAGYEYCIECELSYYQVDCFSMTDRMSCKYDYYIDDIISQEKNRKRNSSKPGFTQSLRFSNNENNFRLNI